MAFLIALLILAVLMVWQAWHSNREATKSWKRMHDTYLRQMESSYSPAYDGDIKTFYSKALLRRLVPSLAHAWDTGYSHSLLYPVSQ